MNREREREIERESERERERERERGERGGLESVGYGLCHSFALPDPISFEIKYV